MALDHDGCIALGDSRAIPRSTNLHAVRGARPTQSSPGTSGVGELIIAS
jgi:hypothetical protein